MVSTWSRRSIQRCRAVGTLKERVGVVEQEQVDRIAVQDAVGHGLVGVVCQGEERAGAVDPFSWRPLFGHRIGRQFGPAQAGGVALHQDAARRLDAADQRIERMDGHGREETVGAAVEQPALGGNQGDGRPVGGKLAGDARDDAGGDAGDLGDRVQICTAPAPAT